MKPGIVQVRNEGRGAGTGIIWSVRGTEYTIVTNHHVVPNDETTIHVYLSDDRVLDAQVIDRNPKLDLAMLKVTAENLLAVPVGSSSQLRTGELVFAIGHPWGQRWVATAGIVSGIGTLKAAVDGKTPQHIKSDVRIEPGYSGGPLLNALGMVVGINAMIFGGDLAVSIPSDVVTNWIGVRPKRQIDLTIEVQPIEIPASLREGIGSAQESGLLVVATNFNGATAFTDMLVGDVLLDVDSQPVDDVSSLVDGLARFDPGDKVRLNLIRGGKFTAVEIAIKALER